MSGPTVDVRIDEPAWRRRLPDARAIVRGAAAAALDRQGGRLTALLGDDAAIRSLNAAFRGRDAATNVLAFPAGQAAEGYLGDIALGLGVCEAEARDQGKALADHVRHLVVHGVLHLRGFDHDEPERATVMEALERRLLAGLGVADPYGEDGDGPSVR